MRASVLRSHKLPSMATLREAAYNAYSHIDQAVKAIKVRLLAAFRVVPSMRLLSPPFPCA